MIPALCGWGTREISYDKPCSAWQMKKGSSLSDKWRCVAYTSSHIPSLSPLGWKRLFFLPDTPESSFQPQSVVGWGLVVWLRIKATSCIHMNLFFKKTACLVQSRLDSRDAHPVDCRSTILNQEGWARLSVLDFLLGTSMFSLGTCRSFRPNHFNMLGLPACKYILKASLISIVCTTG